MTTHDSCAFDLYSISLGCECIQGYPAVKEAGLGVSTLSDNDLGVGAVLVTDFFSRKTLHRCTQKETYQLEMIICI